MVVQDVDHESLRLVVRHIETGRVEVPSDTARALLLLVATDRLLCPFYRDAVAQRLVHAVDDETVLALMLAAHRLPFTPRCLYAAREKKTAR